MTDFADCPPDFPLGVYDTLATAAAAFKKAKLRYAVGGAVAMYAGGYARNTADVDVFIVEKDLDEILDALRLAGFQIVEISDSQYHAQLPRYAKSRIRVDILVSWAPPETVPIFHPTRRKIGAVNFPAFNLHEVVASKATIGMETSAWAKGKNDILAMYLDGLIDLPAIRQFLVDNDVPYLEEFDMIAADVSKPRTNPGYGRRQPRGASGVK